MKEVRRLSVTGQGKTCFVTLPRAMMDELKWGKGHEVQIKMKNDKIVIKKVKAKKKSKQ